ncbi:hypothetical protein VE26_08680 [Devosia chinhatensis]|uniref:Hemin transporter HemP n=1 Tax=Devosia chinhatensis TaxID=429727 RepID=A0A0F5FLV9_9HYPH|nr:hypothetical protein VE26_08680 [Devosia chinhatensis]
MWSQQATVFKRQKVTDVAMSESQNDNFQPRSIAAEDLFKGATEVIVWHAGVPYRLRVTRNDKLILTK